MAASEEYTALGEALIDCTRYDELDEVKELVLVNHADVNFSDDTKKTALHAAAANGSVPLCEFLLAHGAKQTVNEAGNTPLHWAALNGREEVVKLLLKHGADAEARNDAGDTPMSMARRGQHDDVGIYLADAIMQQEKARKRLAKQTATGAEGGKEASEQQPDEEDDDDIADSEEDLTGGGAVAAEVDHFSIAEESQEESAQ